MKFRKKPVVIEARRLTREDFGDIGCWLDPEDDTAGGRLAGWSGPGNPEPVYFDIRTLEGIMRAQEGDWIIKGVADEFYPCKPDIFAATYEPVEDE